MNQKIYLSEDWLFNENFKEGPNLTTFFQDCNRIPGRDPAARPNPSYL